MGNDFDDDDVTPQIDENATTVLEGQLAIAHARAESDARLAAAKLDIATADISDWKRRYDEVYARSLTLRRELDDERKRDHVTEFVECAACAAKPGTPALCASCLANRRAIGSLQRQFAEVKGRLPREPFDVRCADALADEVAVLIIRKVLDSRSPAGDALLDYRNPPQTPRVERLAKADTDLEGANANAARWCDVAIRRRAETAEAIAVMVHEWPDPFDKHLVVRAIREEKWRR